MFTDTTILKTLIKRAWKGSGLHIEHTEDGWLAVGGLWWQFEIDDQEISNKIKAQIVELVGDLPELGQALVYYKKGDPQTEIPGTTFKNLMADWARREKEYQISNVILRTANDYSAVLEGKDDNILVPGWAANLVQGEVDADETLPVIAKGAEGRCNVIWANNKMALMVICGSTDYAGEKAFLEAVKGVDLTWEFVMEE